MSEGFEGIEGLRHAADPLRPAPHRKTGAKAGNGGFDETEERILAAAGGLLTRLGGNKMSMSDVARAAGVARGTLYRYFDSREVLLDALAKRNADLFFDDLARAMKNHEHLTDQLGEFSERIILSTRPADDAFSANNHISMLHMLATQSGTALVRTAKFLQPYLESARERGEVRANLDIPDASEWLARVFLSFTVFQASVPRGNDTPEHVRLFVQRYAIDGLS
ncbi:TetR/AcrR family transcriptional regulator [Streptomyces sp. NPDC059894]|uniref:TetR/AcrR family transcriptional regulator n=1 Tax=unclassified Streptomyces TaxID=2593676 RepID=UPI003660681E